MAKEESEPIIIVKKIKKGGHGGHHGGSWKVAYADFVTAMMAFFLMMWLLNSTSSEQKEQLAQFFQEYSILSDKEFVNKPSPLPQKGDDILDNDKSEAITGVKDTISIVEEIKKGEAEAKKESEDMKEKAKENEQPQQTKTIEKPIVVNKGFEEHSAMANKIKSEIESKLKDIKDQVIVDPLKNSIRIEVIDKTGNPIFDVGSVEPTQEAKNILKVIADSIRVLDTMIAIEGHTDARPYPSQVYTNWELSTGRASSVRILLGQEGVSSDRLLSVSGLADKSPRIKSDPFSPLNRRISILLYPNEKSPKQ